MILNIVISKSFPSVFRFEYPSSLGTSFSSFQISYHINLISLRTRVPEQNCYPRPEITRSDQEAMCPRIVHRNRTQSLHSTAGTAPESCSPSSIAGRLGALDNPGTTNWRLAALIMGNAYGATLRSPRPLAYNVGL